MSGIELRWASIVLAGFASGRGSFALGEGEVDYASALRRFTGAASDKARLGLRVAVLLAMTAPLWMWGRLRSLSSCAPEERGRVLDEMLRHRIYFVRELCLLLKLVACMAIFRGDAPRARTNYDRPPVVAAAAAPVRLVVLRTKSEAT